MAVGGCRGFGHRLIERELGGGDIVAFDPGQARHRRGGTFSPTFPAPSWEELQRGQPGRRLEVIRARAPGKEVEEDATAELPVSAEQLVGSFAGYEHHGA